MLFRRTFENRQAEAQRRASGGQSVAPVAPLSFEIPRADHEREIAKLRFEHEQALLEAGAISPAEFEDIKASFAELEAKYLELGEAYRAALAEIEELKAKGESPPAIAEGQTGEEPDQPADDTQLPEQTSLLGEGTDQGARKRKNK